ncbi:MAG: prepilin-type N-terminal cleavage/methylation domain-containing protein [Planctomycetota bacterium]|jgi:type II secretion system protein J
MRRGFTLLEILLAVVLTAIVMGVLYGVVVSTVEAQKRVEEETLLSEIGPAILTQMREDLEAIYQPDTEKEYFVGLDRAGSGGDRDRVDFVATVMAFGSDDEYADPVFHSVNEIGYQVKDNPDESDVAILYRRLDYFVDEEPLIGGRLLELYNRVASFNVEYYDSENDDWVPIWATKDKQQQQQGQDPPRDLLPPAIKVTLKLRVGDEEGDTGFKERVYTLVVTRPE